MPGKPAQPEQPDHLEARTRSGLLSSNGLLRRLFNAGIDLLFPLRCAGCSRVDVAWCAHCQDELDQTPIALQVKSINGLSDVASTGLHAGKLQAAIHGLKYENVPALARPLGDRMIRCLETLNWPFDILAPVPLHTSRLAQRGYNQSQLLGEYIASRLSLPCMPTALIRQRQTQSQVGLNSQERRANVADAFRADAQLVENHSLLLIDDVCTTGATLSACAQAALTAGARAVYALTVTSAR